MCGWGVRSILLLSLVAIYLEIIGVCIWRMFVFMSVVVIVLGFLRSRPTHGGTVRQQTTPANRDHLYPDSLLFVLAGFLPRISSQRLN